MRQGSVRGEGPLDSDPHAGEQGLDQDRFGEEDEGEPPRRSGRRPRRESGRARGPRRKRRIFRWIAGSLTVLVLAAAGLGYFYYEYLNNRIDTEQLPDDNRAPEATPNAAGQTPLNILVIGSDARDTEANQKLGGAKETFGGTPLADVQMLVHLSADRSNMSVISMPRDTLVEVPQCRDEKNDKTYPASNGRMMTNETLGRGGAACTVLTWEKLTGIRINHFMMVDFAGVVSMADAIGGVPVCVDANIHSRDSQGHGSGLRLEKGTTNIKGEQALQWLRTRYGFEDGSDIGRAKAQHMYMNSMVRELRENATLSNPGRLRSLAEEATDALTVDTGLDSVAKLYDLSKELRKVPPKHITMTTMPYEYQGARVVPKPDDAEQLFRLVREDIALDGDGGKKGGKGAGKKDSPEGEQEESADPKEPTSDDPAAQPAEIGVTVQNATGSDRQQAVQGRAHQVAQLLAGQGYSRATADNGATLSRARTTIRFPSAELEGDAQAVAKSLGLPMSSVRESKDVSTVTVVVGADWRSGEAPEQPKQDDRTPESADALNGADESACMHVDPNFTWE
ncbi:LytR family transcriptional regulator [Streptomyces triticagri]|uniref:LytR family transcriptional regulator n=1 Tax=Streptomyces triticagri TaxID=2293568 RepID=A0A372MAG6_9ACTN|nr:LCP family protein [Streptomyces triticagri]RFU87916.1 LytR family transcriptional regulator [Streptomyces triticagri]